MKGIGAAAGDSVSPCMDAPAPPDGGCHAADILLHPRLKLLIAGAASLLAAFLGLYLRQLPLPHDSQYAGSLFLMWPRDFIGGTPVQLALLGLDTLAALVPVVMIAAIAVPDRLLQRPPALLCAVHEMALVIPLFAFVTTALPRYIANATYSLIDSQALGTTQAIARIEAPLIESIQRSVGTPALNFVCAAVYAGGWMLALLSAPLVLAWRQEPVAVARIATGWILAAVLAVPFFVLLPVFEPWTLNSSYGYLGSDPSAIWFLAAHDVEGPLAALLQQQRVATALCLPSLHVALPALVAALTYQHQFARVAGFCAALTVAVSISVVCLGRHWITDVAAGMLYGLAIARLTIAIQPERGLLLGGRLRL